MADTKITALTALTGANSAPGDLLTLVDVSDTTMDAAGTNKSITRQELQTYNAGTLTTDVKVLNLSATWNNAAVTFTGMKFNATDTASNTASLFLDLQLGGNSAFKVGKNSIEKLNSTNAQTFSLYNTYTDASNYERLGINWNSNVLEITTDQAGTGAGRDIRLIGGPSGAKSTLSLSQYVFSVKTNGSSSNNAVNITSTVISGTSTTHIGWSSGANAGTPDTSLNRVAAGIVGVRNGSTGGGALGMVEQTAPSAPATNGVYIYAQDNGAGKTQLMALFASGAAQQIAIEP